MQTKSSSIYLLGCLLTGFMIFTGCSKDQSLHSKQDNSIELNAFDRSYTKGIEFYALTSTNELVKYSSGNPKEISNVTITGLQNMERILAIDFRPATGQLYGVSNQSRIYVIKPHTGVAVAVSQTPFTPAINGTEVGFDFNPTVDKFL